MGHAPVGIVCIVISNYYNHHTELDWCIDIFNNAKNLPKYTLFAEKYALSVQMKQQYSLVPT